MLTSRTDEKKAGNWETLNEDAEEQSPLTLKRLLYSKLALMKKLNLFKPRTLAL